MAVIDYTSPASFDDLSMNWDAPNMKQVKYIEALCLAIEERGYYVNTYSHAGRWNTVVSFGFLSFELLTNIHKSVMTMIPAFVNHTLDLNGKDPGQIFWTVDAVLFELGCDHVEYPNQYSLDNSAWGKFIHDVLVLLKWKRIDNFDQGFSFADPVVRACTSPSYPPVGGRTIIEAIDAAVSRFGDGGYSSAPGAYSYVSMQYGFHYGKVLATEADYKIYTGRQPLPFSFELYFIAEPYGDPYEFNIPALKFQGTDGVKMGLNHAMGPVEVETVDQSPAYSGETSIGNKNATPPIYPPGPIDYGTSLGWTLKIHSRSSPYGVFIIQYNYKFAA